MSGIAGVWHVDQKPVAPETLAAMSAAMAHRGRDGEGHRLAGPVGFSCQHSWNTLEEHDQIQPLVTPTNIMLVMDGRLDNRDELLAALDRPRDISDAACALAAYEAWTDRFAERLNGDFAIAVFDAPRQRLLLVRDSMGVRPLYYYRDARLFAFGTDIKALLAHPDIDGRPDDEGLADNMFVSARPLDRQEVTCFQGISALVPAHLAVVTRDRIAVQRYWDFDTGRAIRLRSPHEYVEAFGEHFAEAVKRRARSKHPVAVALSGGLDSSSIFCQAETMRRTGAIVAPSLAGIAYTDARVETDERRYLIEIEKQYGVNVERFEIGPLIGLTRGATDQIRAIEAPFVDYLWGVTCELHRRAAAGGARTVLSGQWGDEMLFSTAYLVDLFNSLSWGTIGRHARQHARYYGHDVTNTWTKRFLFDAAKHHVPRRLLPALKRVRLRLFPPPAPKPWFSNAFLSKALRARHHVASAGSGFHSAHARAVYLEARSKYHVHCMEWNNKAFAWHGLDAAYPFLDRDLIAFLMAIPGEMHAHNGVPRALLREATVGILPESIRTRTWKSNFSGFVNEGVIRDLSPILAALSKDSLGARLGYFDPARLESKLAEVAESIGTDECLAGWDTADTFGFELWLQLFSGDPRAEPRPGVTPQEEGVG